MLSHLNIELPNSQKESKAPFTFDSSLLINGQQLPQGSFVSIKVFITDSVVLPVRIYCIRQNGDIVFCDARGTLVAIWKTCEKTDGDAKWITSLLVNDAGAIAGSVACTKQTLDLFRGAVLNRTGDLFLDNDAFILMQQCYVAMLKGVCKVIAATDAKGIKHLFTSDITLNPTIGATVDEAVVFKNEDTINMKNTYSTVLDRQQANGICTITVGGRSVDCRNKRLLIKAAMTPTDASNLRVIREKDCLVLKGVKDA